MTVLKNRQRTRLLILVFFASFFEKNMIENQKKIDSNDKFFGLKLFGSTQEELLITLVDHLKVGKNLKIVFTPNPEQVVQAQEKPEFQQILQKGDILIPDGMGLVWATRLLAWKNHTKSGGVQQRITGIDVVQELLKSTLENEQKVLLLGGRGYQGLPKQVNWLGGYADITNPTPDEEKVVQQVIKDMKPHLVLVALGAPWQENWIWEHRELLEQSQVKVAMVVGGTFDTLLGNLNRAPAWMQAAGLEWLYRLIKQPWRWRRQLRLVTFIKLTLLELLK